MAEDVVTCPHCQVARTTPITVTNPCGNCSYPLGNPPPTGMTQEQFNDIQANLQQMGGDITQLQGMAVQTHEVFEAYMNGGFTEKQSLYLTAVMMSGNPGIPPRSEYS